MKLTVITINYNDARGLRKTVESVLAQRCRDFEYVVIDGGSTDGSQDVLEEYSEGIDFWMSEPDSGIYNAMNKGTARAHGDYCLYLNSGDYLYDDNVIADVLPLLDGTDVICGKVMFDEPGSNKLRRYDKGNPEVFRSTYLVVCSLNHQAMFIRRDVMNKYPYHEDYRIISDWVFCWEALVFGHCSYLSIDNVISVYNKSGISSTNHDLTCGERRQYMHKIMPPEIVEDILVYNAEDTAFFGRIKDDRKLRTLVNLFNRQLEDLYHSELHRYNPYNLKLGYSLVNGEYPDTWRGRLAKIMYPVLERLFPFRYKRSQAGTED